MEPKEFVSVIIPLYNNENFICDAIKSSIDLPEVVEVIVIDDCSTDNSVSKVHSINNPKLKVHKFSQNKGVSVARNYGVKLAESEFIAFLDSDDYFLKNRFEGELDTFTENQDIDALYHCTGSDENSGTEIDRNLQTLDKSYTPKDLHKVLLGTVERTGFFSIDSVTFRKQIFSTHQFDPEIKIGEDTYFFIDSSIFYNYVAGDLVIPRSRYRTHDKNTSVKLSSRFHSDRSIFYKKLHHKFRESPLLKKREKDIILAYYAYNSFAHLSISKKIFFYIRHLFQHPRLNLVKRFHYYSLISFLSSFEFLNIRAKRP